MVIRRIGAWSVGRVFGAIYAALGLLIGLVFAAISMVGAGLMSGNDQIPAGIGAMFGVGAVVFLPICYGILGFLGGALMAALYNVFAGMVGGVEIDVQESIVPGR